MKSMKLLVLDTETTGLIPATDRVIELAAALYDVDRRLVLWQMASLVHGATDNPAESINQIPVAALSDCKAFHDPFEEVSYYSQMADFIVAHNAAFDRGMVGDRLPADKVWICSKSQLRFPKSQPGGRLTHQAVDHGIVIVNAHRAMSDVMTLVELLKVTPDLAEQVTNTQRPHVLIEALVSYDQRQLAKDAGFTWNGAAKRWEKSVPLADGPPQLGFEIRKVPTS